MLRAVVFDVDFTLARPGPDLGPEGYRELGLRYGLDLDPALYEEARAAAFSEVKRHPELDHDEEIWVLFTERVIVGMGGRGDTYRAAVEMEQRWAHSAHFELYEDAVPALATIRARGLRVGLLSNSSRNLADFVDASRPRRRRGAHVARAREDEAARVDLPGACSGCSTSRRREAVMVGDTLHDDIEGARAVGMQAVLIDREDRHPEIPDRLADLRGLAEALGLE